MFVFLIFFIFVCRLSLYKKICNLKSMNTYKIIHFDKDQNIDKHCIKYMKNLQIQNVNVPIEADYENIDVSFAPSYNICQMRENFSSSPHDSTIELANITNGSFVLDMGCGIGDFAVYTCLKQMDTKFVCFTNSESMYKQCCLHAQKNKVDHRITFILFDFNNTKIWDIISQYPKFDRIVFLESIGYCLDRKKLLHHMYKRLNFGGKLYIKTITFETNFASKHMRKVEKLVEKWRYNFSTQNCIVNDLISIGFDSSHIHFSSFLPFFSLFFINLSDIINLSIWFYKNEIQLGDHWTMPLMINFYFRFFHVVCQKV